jgi:hypothetical protein
VGQVGKKSKQPDKRPARARYWATRRLETRKVRNLVKCCGMTLEAAKKKWAATRTTRIKTAK